MLQILGFFWGCGTLNASLESSVVNHLHGAVQVSAMDPNTWNQVDTTWQMATHL